MFKINEDNQTLQAIKKTKSEYQKKIDELTKIELEILKRMGVDE